MSRMSQAEQQELVNQYTKSRQPGAAAAAPQTRLTEAQIGPSLRKLYLVSVLHGFSDACAKLATPGFVLELFGEDYLGASAFFALVNSGQSIAEFLLNPLLGSLSDRFGCAAPPPLPRRAPALRPPRARRRKAFLMLWPPINTVSRLLVMKWTNPRVILAQQVLVKMLEYTFEKAIAASSADMVTGDRRSVVAGNVSMLKIGLGFLLGAGFISRFSANDPRPVRPPPPTPAAARAPRLTGRCVRGCRGTSRARRRRAWPRC